jgi:hypothetical protein
MKRSIITLLVTLMLPMMGCGTGKALLTARGSFDGPIHPTR